MPTTPTRSNVAIIRGVEVLRDDSLVDVRQVRFPKSRKRRIRAKWALRIKNYEALAHPGIYVCLDVCYAHPTTIERLLAAETRHEQRNDSVA